jgi:hypothetical protein
MVETISLMDIALLYDLERVDFIKIDIEGTEDSLLQGSASFFAAFRPRMVIEPHMVAGQLVTESVIASLSRFGYRCQTIDQHGVSLPLIVAEPVSG